LLELTYYQIINNGFLLNTFKSSIRVLFLHPNYPDYAGDGLLHGLRQLLGKNCIDFPRADYMYNDYPVEKWKGVCNEGKVLYGHLQDEGSLRQERENCMNSLDAFDCIILSNPYGFGKAMPFLLAKLEKNKHRNKIAWVDGSDSMRFFPFASIRNLIFKYPSLLFSPVKYGWYFKREFGGLKEAAPGILSHFCKGYKVHPLRFSIPEFHINEPKSILKSRLFPTYLVDEELAYMTNASYGPLGDHRFIFRTESAYWNDISQSRFGPTKKRAGWDALRHYEYAAKGAVLCFKELDIKPSGCSPHGLGSHNCVSYHEAGELMDKINLIGEDEYFHLQKNTHSWIKENTTVEEARRFLNIIIDPNRKLD